MEGAKCPTQAKPGTKAGASRGALFWVVVLAVVLLLLLFLAVHMIPSCLLAPRQEEPEPGGQGARQCSATGARAHLRTPTEAKRHVFHVKGK